jgi:hypothetical protein
MVGGLRFGVVLHFTSFFFFLDMNLEIEFSCDDGNICHYTSLVM